MIRPLLIAGALLCVIPVAHAQRFTPITARQLGEFCTGGDRVRAQQCESYIDAVADTAGFYQRLVPEDGSKGGKLPGYLCIPDNATGVTLRENFVRWLRGHGDAGTRQASGAVMDSLYVAYPCK